MISEPAAAASHGAAATARRPILELRHVTKRFPGVLANDDVNVSVSPGEILALLGENGAGKSTLMNVAYGLLAAEAGEIVVAGEPVRINAPRDAIRLGIGMVHQHFMLVETLTVTENIVLGAEPVSRVGIIARDRARERVVELSERYGLKVEPDARVLDLSVGMQQRVEILKALYRDARVLILDEPTAVLTPQEVDDLFNIVRQLVTQGLAVVIITHKLDEVMKFADRIVVMRSGKVVGETTPSASTEQSLATMMVGREVVLRVEKTTATPGDVLLEVEDLHVRDDRKLEAVRGMSFSVRRGEVVGIAGVDGNGQTELVDAIVGLRRPESGTIKLGGRDITHESTAKTIEAGVSHVPADRHRRGLVLEFDLIENVVLGDQSMPPYSRFGVLDRGAMEREARSRIADYDVRTPDEHVAAGTLSGGNQQKLVLARELGRNPELLVASQPTRGLDVGAIEFVHGRILSERDSNKAVLLVSMELEEIQALSDRILVVFEGRIVAEFAGGTVSDQELGINMTGGTSEESAGRPADTPGGDA
jgi:simple sugar transport system ATP-binding protein